MALKSFDEIGAKKRLAPPSEAGRINTIADERRLHGGDFAKIGVVGIDSATPAVKTNWFRRVPSFYSEFMWSEGLTIETGNPRMDEALPMPQITKAFQRATNHMVAYGAGVVMASPADPSLLVAVAPDQHYEVADESGKLLGDIVIIVNGASAEPNRTAQVIKYPIEGDATWELYGWTQGTLGERKQEFEIAKRRGRQVVVLEHNPERVGLFPDMSPLVAQIARTPTQVARALKRNANPHLYGPEGMLVRDESGKATIDAEGMYLPMQAGDERPGYLSWDASPDASRWSYETALDGLFSVTGLSKILLEPNAVTGILSGTALRRLALPFHARLSSYTRINEDALRAGLAVWNANRAAGSREVFAYEPSAVTFDWGYEGAFRDDGEGAVPADAA